MSVEPPNHPAVDRITYSYGVGVPARGEPRARRCHRIPAIISIPLVRREERL